MMNVINKKGVVLMSGCSKEKAIAGLRFGAYKKGVYFIIDVDTNKKYKYVKY